MTNTVGILPGAATMASASMIAACRACYAATSYLMLSSSVGAYIRRAWERGDAREVAYWCAWLQVALNREHPLPCPSTCRDLARDLDRALTDLCCTEQIAPLDVWRSIEVRPGPPSSSPSSARYRSGPLAHTAGAGRSAHVSSPASRSTPPGSVSTLMSTSSPCSIGARVG